ncbi:MAG: exopolyphosphatase [Cyanobacteria bacterium QS_8_64_29]|nr:MAG: exopolyphosphatase [Cyanobacteria bacterium QS_8_64_29]
MVATDSALPNAVDIAHPTGQAERNLAAIDIGTNSIHMVIVRIQPELPAFNIIAREKDTVRLGERDPETGAIKAEALERGLAALQRGRDLARSFGAEQIVAVATSAVRESPNGREFLKQVASELGIFVSLISGQEEARRIYLGVLSGMEFQDRPHAIADIGGGSTELILGDGREPRFLSSIKVGAVRLTEELVTTDPISTAEFEYLQAYIREMLARPSEELRSQLAPGEPLQLVGTSGTIETLASLHAKETLDWVPSPLQGYQFSRSDLQGMVDRLAARNRKQRAAMPGIGDKRAEILLPGALILLETMKLLGCEDITICERALREGLVVDWMLAHGLIADRLRYQGSVRQRSVLNIAHKYRVDLAYSERVAQLALSLFDWTQGCLHEWSTRERELLWAGAILHECGIHVSHSAYHKHSYYLIRNGELLGFTEAEIEAIANLARYHRKNKPKKKHEGYKNLPDKQHRKLVEQLSTLLRLAVALDRRKLGAIAQLRCEYRAKGKEIVLHLSPARAEDDCALELWSVEDNKGPFEEAFGIQLTPQLEPAAVAGSPAEGAQTVEPQSSR